MSVATSLTFKTLPPWRMMNLLYKRPLPGSDAMHSKELLRAAGGELADLLDLESRQFVVAANHEDTPIEELVRVYGSVALKLTAAGRNWVCTDHANSVLYTVADHGQYTLRQVQCDFGQSVPVTTLQALAARRLITVNVEPEGRLDPSEIERYLQRVAADLVLLLLTSLGRTVTV